MARSLLAETGNFSYNEIELCNTAEVKEKTSVVEKPSSIFVYPNPAKKVINVDFNNYQFDQAELLLRDPLGQLS